MCKSWAHQTFKKELLHIHDSGFICVLKRIHAVADLDVQCHQALPIACMAEGEQQHNGNGSTIYAPDPQTGFADPVKALR